MAFIEMPAGQDVGGPAAELFAADRQAIGYVANHTRLFARRPAVYLAWRQLSEAIKANMDPRRYELATPAWSSASSPITTRPASTRPMWR